VILLASEWQERFELSKVLYIGKKKDTTGFGRYLRACRRAARLSQRQLANQLGIDFTYVSKLENGHEEPPSADTLRRLAVVLGVPEEHMLAKGGKIPAELRKRASEDPEFAYLVQQLPNVPPQALRRIFEAAGLDIPIFSEVPDKPPNPKAPSKPFNLKPKGSS
jgi:transcriptional regulator with XRE-family HTH domain